MSKRYKNIKFTKEIFTIALTILLLFSFNKAFSVKIDTAQTSSNEKDKNFSVKWLSTISSSGDFLLKQGFLRKLADFITGDEGLRMVRPNSIFAVDTNMIIVLDQGQHVLLSLDKNNGNFDYLIRTNNEGFPSLLSICSLNNDNLLFTDSKIGKIFQLYDKYTKIKYLNDSLTLKQPTGIAFSSVKNEIWVAETANHRLVVLDEKGKIKRIFGTRGKGWGEFNFPTYIWIDKNGSIYINDSMNFRIQILSPEGVVKTVFGEAGDATGYFASSKGIATDSYGHIYIVDALFHTVQIFNKDGHFLYKFGQHGKNDGEFSMPTGIFIDNENMIYVADSFNSRIQIFQLVYGGHNEKNK